MDTAPSLDDIFCLIEKKNRDRLESPMRWVGMYIAAASSVCTLAMAADVFNGFRKKKFWFPCKYFYVNATSLTLLAISMKLPVDLTTDMFATTDWLAKLSSLIFMTTSMGNFMSSLGSMNNQEIRTNVIALGIMVITIIANVWIQLIQLKPLLTKVEMLNEVFVATVFMFLLLVGLVSSALTVPTIKKSMELTYHEMHNVVLKEEQEVERREMLRIRKQRKSLMTYWVMAETGSPQFMMSRSVVCVASSGICLLTALTLVEAHIRHLSRYFWDTHSMYGWSTKWILVIQSTGVVVGTIAPTLRCFIAIRIKCSQVRDKSAKKGFKIETYWIQRLVDWRDSMSTSQIERMKSRKYLHDTKVLMLNFCIGVQILIVWTSKLFVLVSASIMRSFLFCFTCIMKLKKDGSLNGMGTESGHNTELNLGRYVLLLEGEEELPKGTLKNICNRAEKVIKTGRKQQPKNLLNLLRKYENFRGVREFDSNQVPNLHSQEPPNIWTLPVVTLTSIAVSLPKISECKIKQLITSVSEGLTISKLIAKTLETNGDLLNIRNAADFTWVEVVLYRKWQDNDLRELSLKGKNSKEVLEELSKKAVRTVTEFKKDPKDLLMENPVNWPYKVISANSMYRISSTLLLACEVETGQTNEGLFEHLSKMIADILAACFTNLARVITIMCQCNAIEEREKSVHEAFLLLGKTEEILDHLQRHKWPSMDPYKAAYIEEWRALIGEHFENSVDSTSSSSIKKETNLMFGEEQVAVLVDC